MRPQPFNCPGTFAFSTPRNTSIFLTDDEPQNSLVHLHAFDLTLAAKNRHFTFLQALLLFSLLPPAKNVRIGDCINNKSINHREWWVRKGEDNNDGDVIMLMVMILIQN